MNSRHSYLSGNSKDLEVTSQDLGTKASQVLFFLISFFNVYLFFWERERQSTSRGGAEREKEGRHRIRSRLQALSTEPDVGFELMNHEFVTRAEVGRLTDRATQAHPPPPQPSS